MTKFPGLEEFLAVIAEDREKWTNPPQDNPENVLPVPPGTTMEQIIDELRLDCRVVLLDPIPPAEAFPK